ncbi:MAG: hypothetical protein Q8R16_01535 [bacterium]|nr:hypothetical protein [bacterium]
MDPQQLLRIRSPRWNPSKFPELGRGGEAVVYRLRPDTAAKVFLLPNAMEYADQPQSQEAARVRIREMQTKLDAFPRDLPPEVVAPTGVLVNEKGQVFGYVMPLIKGVGLDQLSRTSSIGTSKVVSTMLTKFYDLMSALHGRGVVVGDCNEHNIIVARRTPHLIDADAMQFGPYQCRTFMPRFVAPELVRAEKPEGRSKKVLATPATFSMVSPHTELTDWYSFLVIAMRLLTYTDPYGGVVAGMDLSERMDARVTVFDQRVVYPAVARPLAEVSRPILEAFFRAFHRGERFIPDRNLFAGDVLTQTQPQKSAVQRTRRKRHVQQPES